VDTTRPAPSTSAALTHALRTTPILVAVAVGWIVGDASAAHGTRVPEAILAAVAAVGTLAWLAPADPLWRRLGTALLACSIAHLAAYRVYRPVLPAEHVARAPMHVPLQIVGIVEDDAGGNGGRARVALAAEAIDDDVGWRPARGHVWLTVRHSEHTWRAGDRLRGPMVLRRPRNFGNPGEFDSEGHLARRGVYVTGYADDDAAFERLAPAGTGGTWIDRWRRGVGTLFRDTLPETQAAVLGALIIGTEAALPRTLRTAFSRAGVSHVLSISGLHVGLVAAGGYTVSRWLLTRSRWLLLTANVPKLAVVLSIVPVLLYAGIAGGNVATTRAVIMILVFLGAVVVDRQRHLIASLAVAAIIVLLTAPGSALDISFQLSFVAVLGLTLAMERFWPFWRRQEEERLLRLRGWRAWLWRSLAVYAVVSVSALAATVPLTAWHFNQVSLVAPLANALVVPLLGSVAVALGLLAAMLYAISTPLARACVMLAGPFVQLGLWVVDLCAALPGAAVRVVTPTLFELALLYAALLSLACLRGRVRLVSVVMLVLLGVADGVYWYADRYHRRDLRVTFLSVGQGDSAVVELPGGEVMVVDGGGLGSDSFDVGERVIAPFLWSRKIAHVDYLVLSHPQWDHYGGLTFLASHFSPREFWWNGENAASERFAELRRILQENGVRQLSVHRAERRRLGVVDAVTLAPPPQLDGLSVNDESVVVSLTYAERRILFTGDIETPAEAELVAAADGQLTSTVLKVPHHGSHTSSSPQFLAAVAPALAVVSAGFENRYGFPHPDVMRRYAGRHCPLVRTDLDGAVQVQIAADGRVVTRTYVPREDPSNSR